MTWVGTGVAVVGTISNIAGGQAAKKAAEAAAKEQAQLTFAQRQEEIRMKRKASRQQRGTAIAAVGASNIQMSGSSERFINAMDTENMREIAYAKNAARLEQRAIKKGASGAGAGLFANAGAALGQAAGLVAGHYLSQPPTPDTLGGLDVSGHTAAARTP